MVISAENRRQSPDPMLAAAPPARAEAQSYHHNFSFLILKKWRSQRLLRCLNVNLKGELIKSPPPVPRSDPIELEGDDRALEKVRKKTASSCQRPSSPTVDGDGTVESKGVIARGEEGPHVRMVPLRSEDAERPRFSIMLSREEIDEDIYAVTGARARRRPKKRSRMAQKQLDMLFSGLWLGEITTDSYKVTD